MSQKKSQTKDFTRTFSIGCTRLAVACFFIRLLFYKPSEITSDDKILLRVIEDDTFSFWIYHYVDDEFTLREMYNTYCKE